MDLPLPQQTYQSRSKPFSSERLLNMLFEKANTGSNAYMLIGTPGLKEYFDFGGDERILGMCYLRSFLVVATGSGIYVMYKEVINERTGEFVVRRITQKAWSDLGVGTTNNPVQMVSNGDMVLVLNSEENIRKLFVVDLFGEEPLLPESWSILPVVVPSENTSYTSIAYISGVFLSSCQINKMSYVQFTDVLDSEMKYAFQLDTALTNLAAVKSNMREVWAFGSNSIEVLAPSGEPGNDFFVHVPGAYINKGCVCKNSITTYESSFLFYGTDGNIYVSSGYAVQNIATPAIIDMIKSWGILETEEDREGVIGQVYSQSGHTFYVLKFKKFGKTLMYDLTTASWLERESGNGGEWEGEYITRRPSGELIVSSATNSLLYTMDNNYYTDNGETIRREFVFQTLSAEGKKRLYFYSLVLEMDSGLGPNDSVMLSWSDDGGYTWSKERTVKLGNYGQYNKKIQFRRLGSAISRTFRVRLSTASMINVLRASVDVEEGQF